MLSKVLVTAQYMLRLWMKENSIQIQRVPTNAYKIPAILLTKLGPAVRGNGQGAINSSPHKSLTTYN
jgi:hypothetical protein